MKNYIFELFRPEIEAKRKEERWREENFMPGNAEMNIEK